MLDNNLYKLALDRRSRIVLANAVRALADVLAADGIMLPVFMLPRPR